MKATPASVATLPPADIIEQVVLVGDLSQLTAMQRVEYYRAVCHSVGVNPLTKPFDYITLNGKLVLYATRTCTDQIRANAKISIAITGREILDDVYVVTARGTMPDGRVDEATGAVTLAGLKGDAKANAYLKCETKAKRRLTLSLVGLGWLDESEISSVPHAQAVTVDVETGEITAGASPPAAPAPAQATVTPAARARLVELTQAAQMVGFTVGPLTAWFMAVAEGRTSKHATPADIAAMTSLLEAVLRVTPPMEPADIIRLIESATGQAVRWTPDQQQAVLDTLAGLGSREDREQVPDPLPDPLPF